MITSPHNPRIQHVRALIEKRKVREEERAFVVEGVRLVEEGLHSGWQANLVLYSNRLSSRGREVINCFERSGAEVYEVDAGILDNISDTDTPQGILAIYRQPEMSLPDCLDFILIADNLRDPGNLGTLLRSAAAAGVQAVFISPGCADVFAPKVLRAGMGAHFRMPVFTLNWEDIRSICQDKGLRILLADVTGGTACWQMNLRQPTAIMVGNEAEGASLEARDIAHDLIHIPMPGKSESLNASVAASILLFEIVRQRQTGLPSDKGNLNEA